MPIFGMPADAHESTCRPRGSVFQHVFHASRPDVALTPQQVDGYDWQQDDIMHTARARALGEQFASGEFDRNYGFDWQKAMWRGLEIALEIAGEEP